MRSIHAFAANIHEALREAVPAHRASLTQIARVFAEGERSEANGSLRAWSSPLTPEARTSTAIWEDFSIDDFQRLARAMPRAAAQIQDVHLSACSTSGQAWLGDAVKDGFAAFGLTSLILRR